MAELTDYYLREIRYLRESGKQFAKDFPDVAGRLNLDAHQDADPTIERLFEGFAYLTAKIHQRIEDGLPELSTTLLEALEPCLVRPVPSVTMLDFTPRSGMLSMAKSLDRGTAFRAFSHQGNNQPFTFCLAQNATIEPIEVSRLDVVSSPGSNKFILEFKKKSPLAKFAFPSDLRLTFVKDDAISWSLMYCLGFQLSNVSIAVNGVPFANMDKPQVQILGTTPEQCLLPEETGSMPSARNMREFFTCEEKCLGIILQKIPLVDDSWQSVELHFNIDTSCPLSSFPAMNASHVGVNQYPAINLFERNADPILLDAGALEYPVHVNEGAENQVYSVVSIHAGNARGSGSMSLSPYGHLIHGSSVDMRYHVYYTQDQQGRRRASLTLPVAQLAEQSYDVISTKVFCYQGTLVRDQVQIGDVSQAQAGFPDSIQVRNVSRPSIPVAPVLAAQAHLSFLKAFQCNYYSLANREALVAYLELLSMGARSASSKLVPFIETVSVNTMRVQKMGTLIPMLQFEVLVKDNRIHGNSWLELGRYGVFARLLFSLFEDQTPVNSLVALHFHIEPLGVAFDFDNTASILE